MKLDPSKAEQWSIEREAVQLRARTHGVLLVIEDLDQRTLDGAVIFTRRRCEQ
jgi:hypothetical protein